MHQLDLKLRFIKMMNSSPLFHFSEDNYKCVHISSTDASVENFVGSMVEFFEKQRE